LTIDNFFMSYELAPTRFSRFDKAVWATIIGALLLTSALVWGNGRFPLLPTFTPDDDPRLLYIGWETESDFNQLYTIRPDGSDQLRLTNEPNGVLDFAIAPDGSRIVYSARNLDGSADLWQLDGNGGNRRQLLACGLAHCSQPAWHPDGRRLVYERRNIATPGAPPGPPRIWWLDSETGQTLAVFQDTQWLGLGAAFSPDGRWLSYIAPVNQEIQAYNLETGESVIIPSKSGEEAVWSLDSASLLVSEMQIDDERFVTHLFRANLADATLENLSGEGMDTNDGQPTYAPDGSWIAFNRKKPRAPMGKQLWLMRPDGEEQTALTDNANIHYGQPAWSPDGTHLVVQGYLLAEPGAQPTLWLVNLATKELTPITTPAIQPAWIP
jgi:Tol biopolymer transport system component